MSLSRPVAVVRRAVRRCLADLDPGDAVLVACSGGADSLALAAAAVREGGRESLRIVGVSVDHGLQEGSATQAERVRRQLLDLGCADALVVTVEVDPAGEGPEAAARRARYDALARSAEETGAACVLLGHTRDDQAETVLLGLARGSGGRSLAGMPPVAGRYRRPLLEVSRAETIAACEAEGLEPWHDPHNADPAYTRVRVRRRVLPVLEAELGPGVTEALARTAGQLRDDVEALDALAQVRYDDLVSTATAAIPVVGLVETPRAIATRVLRLAAVDAGAIDAELFHVHVRALHDLVTGEIRGEVQLPGHVTAHIEGGSLKFRATGVSS